MRIAATSISSVNFELPKMKLDKAQFQISNLLCFGIEPQIIDELRPLNIIIGKNNSGKSTMLDAIHAFCVGSLAHESMSDANVPESSMSKATLCYRYQLPKESIGTGIPRQQVDIKLGGNSHVSMRDPVQNIEVHCDSFWVSTQLSRDGKLSLNKLDVLESVHPHTQALIRHFERQLGDKALSPIHGKKVFRIAAERDIIPEKDVNQIEIGKNGNGLTAAFQKLEHYQEQPDYLVKRTFLNKLNEIIQPDFMFEDISVRKTGEGTFSIFFCQDGRFTPVGQLGSGLKTIMLVLANTEVLPVVAKTQLDNTVFLFEELENNLHPSMLRRLLAYVRNFAVENEAIFFITTHSSAVIDMFGNDPNAQILHLSKPDKTVTITRVDDHLKKCGILDDLGNRASDILQCNGVVWVEGPSDVIYFNKWIEIWSDGILKPGIHYQCIQYGGSNIASLELNSGSIAENEDEQEDEDDEESPEVMVERLTNGLLVNRNFIVTCDSDKRKKNDELKPHVKRIIDEGEKLKGFVWVTDGKEVENYLPLECVRQAAKRAKLDQPDQFDDVLELIHKTGRKRKKTQLAEFCVENEHFTKENLSTVRGLAVNLDKCVAEIKKWNGFD